MTVDPGYFDDGCVTLRCRDSMRQARVGVEDAVAMVHRGFLPEGVGEVAVE